MISGDEPSTLSHEQISTINEWLETLETGKEERKRFDYLTRDLVLYPLPYTIYVTQYKKLKKALDGVGML